ncbi:flagellar hook-length control protein FliK [Bosea sp. (in: a-proteobacteria)]|uniref:flagellar hook-length control protein FliK n=1 Tax=Bosea sp. (in: a-proteobacteria) TaxID=1871050 RepID=UPI002FC5DE83
MSTASISHSPYETALPGRRDTAKTRRTDEVFTLPPAEKPVAQAPADRPRPRLDEDRGASETGAAERDRAGRKGIADAAVRAGEGEGADRGGKATGETKPSEAGAETGKQAGESTDEKVATGEKPATGEENIPALPLPAPTTTTVEERKAALEAAVKGAPPVPPEGTAAVSAETSQSGAVAPTAEPSEIGAQFLALAALALQPGGPAEPEDAAAKDGSATVATGESMTTGVVPANAVVPPVAPALPAKANGEASAGGEAAAADIKAGLKPAVIGAPMPAEAGMGDSETVDEAGAGTSEAAATATIEGKAPERSTTAAQGSPAADGGQGDAPQQAAPPTPQAILAAGPLAPGKPEAPLTPLDAAAQANAQAQAEANARASVETTRPTPLHVVPVEIGARALAGNKRFDIRLDPAELGRVDVRLEISDDGSVSAKLTVDRVETLHLLQRDARTLERAFEQAGLKPSESGVEMSLRDSSDQSSRQNRQDDEGARTRRAWVETAEESALAAETMPLRGAARLGGVDLSI